MLASVLLLQPLLLLFTSASHSCCRCSRRSPSPVDLCFAWAGCRARGGDCWVLPAVLDKPSRRSAAEAATPVGFAAATSAGWLCRICGCSAAANIPGVAGKPRGTCGPCSGVMHSSSVRAPGTLQGLAGAPLMAGAVLLAATVTEYLELTVHSSMLALHVCSFGYRGVLLDMLAPCISHHTIDSFG